MRLSANRKSDGEWNGWGQSQRERERGNFSNSHRTISRGRRTPLVCRQKVDLNSCHAAWLCFRNAVWQTCCPISFQRMKQLSWRMDGKMSSSSRTQMCGIKASPQSVPTRYTCLVCFHRPVFDTVDTLTVHRKGKRHLEGWAQFSNKSSSSQSLLIFC